MARSKVTERKKTVVAIDAPDLPSAREDLALVRRAPWLHDPWQRFVAMHAQGRVPHGLMISGDRGLGTQVLARSIAAFLLCSHPVTQPDAAAPCGACPACRLQQAGTHPDLIQVVDDPAVREIPVDGIRALIGAFGLTRHGSLRIAFIDQAERMNRAAANSLLKLLEEPPLGSLFLLTAERADLLPSTIRSRVQRLTVATPNRTAVVDWLCRAHDMPRPDAELLWYIGGGELVAGKIPDWDWQGVTQTWLNLVTGHSTPLAAAKAWLAIDRPTLARWLIRVWLTIQRLSSGLPCDAPVPLCPVIQAMAHSRPAEEWLRLHPILLSFLQTAAHPLNEELARERLALDLVDPAIPGRLA